MQASTAPAVTQPAVARSGAPVSGAVLWLAMKAAVPRRTASPTMKGQGLSFGASSVRFIGRTQRRCVCEWGELLSQGQRRFYAARKKWRRGQRAKGRREFSIFIQAVV